MIIKIGGGGKSFAGLSQYLTHDPKAETDKRVAWTHTLNLSNDHIPSAVDEMYRTARNAEILKQEAGIRGGGRATEATVKHISLNWSPDDNPSREHMIGTAEGFLQHMKWQEQQAVLVAHDDKSYRHVHIMLNMVHPETGLRLNDDFERRRAQSWAREYEEQNGRIYCEQRVKNAEDCEKAMPRNIWMAFQENEKEFQRTETLLSENREIRLPELESIRTSEWRILKEIQKVERQEFFAQGKLEFSKLRTSIYREVREEFRPRWAEYYDARKNGSNPDELSDLRAKITAEQKSILEPRRDAACKELRETRDLDYRSMLSDQQYARTELRWRQDVGLDNASFLTDLAATKSSPKELEASFHDAAREVGRPQPSNDVSRPDDNSIEDSGDHTAGGGSGGTERVGQGVRHTAGAFLDSLFFDLTTMGGGSTNPPPRSAEEEFQAAADETQRRQQVELHPHLDAEWREREKERE